MAKKKSSGCCISPDEEWKVERDLNTLTESDAIRKDAKRMAKVKALANKKLQEVAAVAGSVADKD